MGRMTCWLLHKWGKWEMGEATYAGIFSKNSYVAAIQTRRCEACGKVEIRRLA